MKNESLEIKLKNCNLENLIYSINFLSNYNKVTFVLNNDFSFDNLIKILKNIDKDNITLITNGNYFNSQKEIKEISKYVNTIDINIYHYNNVLNNTMLKEGISFKNLADKINIFKKYNNDIKINICTKIRKDYIDCNKKAEELKDLAIKLNADSVIFSEINIDSENFIPMSEIFDIKSDHFFNNFKVKIDSIKDIDVFAIVKSAIKNPVDKKNINIDPYLYTVNTDPKKYVSRNHLFNSNYDFDHLSVTGIYPSNQNQNPI